MPDHEYSGHSWQHLDLLLWVWRFMTWWVSNGRVDRSSPFSSHGHGSLFFHLSTTWLRPSFLWPKCKQTSSSEQVKIKRQPSRHGRRSLLHWSLKSIVLTLFGAPWLMLARYFVKNFREILDFENFVVKILDSDGYFLVNLTAVFLSNKQIWSPNLIVIGTDLVKKQLQHLVRSFCHQTIRIVKFCSNFLESWELKYFWASCKIFSKSLLFSLLRPKNSNRNWLNLSTWRRWGLHFALSKTDSVSPRPRALGGRLLFYTVLCVAAPVQPLGASPALAKVLKADFWPILIGDSALVVLNIFSSGAWALMLGKTKISWSLLSAISSTMASEFLTLLFTFYLNRLS